MKKLLISFLQIVCLLQVVGNGQLNTTLPGKQSSHFSLLSFNGSEHSDFISTQNALITKIQSNSSRPRKTVGLIAENVQEEYEPFSAKNQLEDGHYFTCDLHAYLSEYHDRKNSLAFCEQLSFTPVNKRHIVFQVFRI